MDINEAVSIIERACASIQADLQTHQTIQTALSVVKQALQPSGGDADPTQ